MSSSKPSSWTRLGIRSCVINHPHRTASASDRVPTVFQQLGQWTASTHVKSSWTRLGIAFVSSITDTEPRAPATGSRPVFHQLGLWTTSTHVKNFVDPARYPPCVINHRHPSRERQRPAPTCFSAVRPVDRFNPCEELRGPGSVSPLCNQSLTPNPERQRPGPDPCPSVRPVDRFNPCGADTHVGEPAFQPANLRREKKLAAKMPPARLHQPSLAPCQNPATSHE